MTSRIMVKPYVQAFELTILKKMHGLDFSARILCGLGRSGKEYDR